MAGAHRTTNELQKSMDWYPAKFFTGVEPETPYALLLLNQPLNARVYKQLASDASMIICVDGGANELCRIFRESRTPIDRFPDAIVGDLDSLEDDVRDYFKHAGGTQILHYPEQDSTDLTKALRWLRNHYANNSHCRIDVIVLGGLGGRVDQGFSAIHHLFRAVTDTDLLDGNIYLLSDQSLSFVLDKGRNVIHGLAPASQRIFQKHIGIIPAQGPAVISTEGLQWDVKDWRTEIGGQISTSNHIRNDVVEIETSHRVLLTIELADALHPH